MCGLFLFEGGGGRQAFSEGGQTMTSILQRAGSLERLNKRLNWRHLLHSDVRIMSTNVI